MFNFNLKKFKGLKNFINFFHLYLDVNISSIFFIHLIIKNEVSGQTNGLVTIHL
jgi:hypothetical protein